MNTQEYTNKSLSKINNNYLVFDIETGTDPRHLEFMPEFKAPSNYKDPVKIEANIKEQQTEWLADVKLSAFTGYIMAIGYMKNGQFESDLIDLDNINGEEILLYNFWKYYDSATLVVGHNIRNFDMPFIWRRSIKYGIRPLWQPHKEKKWEDKLFDTKDVWRCGAFEGKGKTALQFISKFLGVGEKNGEGSEFEELYLNPETRDKAIDYLKNDLTLTDGVYRKLTCLD